MDQFIDGNNKKKQKGSCVRRERVVTQDINDPPEAMREEQ
jgi:hypothetical protein